MFYNRGWTKVNVQKFIDILNKYLTWYNEKRIKISLRNMSPLEYRRDLELAV
jgi:transposase InsO family protein